jgi:hypothetical protein
MATMTMAVPIIPARDAEYGIVERDRVGVHFWGRSGIEPKDSMTMYRIRVEGIEELYESCSARGPVHPNAPLEDKPWGAREFAVTDGDGNLLTFFER